MKKIFILLLIVNYSFAQSGKEVKINFINTFDNRVVETENRYYHFSSNDSILFETVRYYISGIKFFRDDELIFSEKNSFHLIDASEKNSTQINIPVNFSGGFNYVQFNLGIDSVTNSIGVSGGDLDPVKGMYWTWNSGYINVKLEGRSNRCATRNHEFQFHLGGYAQPFVSMQDVRLSVNNTSQINIELALDKFFQTIDLSKENSVMMPGRSAVILSDKIANLFSIRER